MPIHYITIIIMIWKTHNVTIPQKPQKGDPSQAALYGIINIMASLIFFTLRHMLATCQSSSS